MKKKKNKKNIEAQIKAYRFRKFISQELRSVGVYKVFGKHLGCQKTKLLEDAYADIYGEPVLKIIENKFVPEKEFVKEIKSQGHVYIMGNFEKEVCKIGYSKNPKKRLKDVQIGCPYPIEIILLFSGTMVMEKLLHEKYKKLNTSGEWFSIEGDLKDMIYSKLTL